MTPMEYIENLYAARGCTVKCREVEVGLSYLRGADGKFVLAECSTKAPHELTNLDGFHFLNFYYNETTRTYEFAFLVEGEPLKALLKSFSER